MATIDSPVYSTTSARQARGRRNYLKSLQRFPVGARRFDRKTTPVDVIPDRFWLLWVAVLSLPSLVFLLLCIFCVPGDLVSFLDVRVMEAWAISGGFGAITAFAAFVVTIMATLRAGIARRTKIALWTLAVLSLACWLYIWISFSAFVQMPPLFPLKM